MTRSIRVTGTSKRGDWREALADAIKRAKEQLPSDYVTWSLCEVGGENGGIVLVDVVSITIEASPASA